MRPSRVGHATMNIQIFLLALCCVLAKPGEPPNVAAPEETLNSVDDSLVALETDKADEVATELPSVVNVTITPEAEPKNATEETIESIVLPEAGSAAKEHSSSLAIFFLLFVLILCIFLIHLLLRIKFHYLPESLAIGRASFGDVSNNDLTLSVPWSCGGHVHDGSPRG